MPISNYLSNKVLEASLANVSYTTPTTVYLSLHSTQCNASTAGTELSGNNYSRQAATFGTASSGEISTTANISFTANGGDWSSAVSSALYDNSTGGNMLYFTNIVPKLLKDGETTTFLAGEVVIKLT